MVTAAIVLICLIAWNSDSSSASSSHTPTKIDPQILADAQRRLQLQQLPDIHSFAPPPGYVVGNVTTRTPPAPSDLLVNTRTPTTPPPNQVRDPFASNITNVTTDPPGYISITPYTTSRYYDPTYRPAVGYHFVNGSFRRDGTYVSPHYQTNADDSFWNNWSSSGNVNPFTGRVGTKMPRLSSGGGSTYVSGHYRSNGTYVHGYLRRR